MATTIHMNSLNHPWPTAFIQSQDTVTLIQVHRQLARYLQTCSLPPNSLAYTEKLQTMQRIGNSLEASGVQSTGVLYLEPGDGVQDVNLQAPAQPVVVQLQAPQQVLVQQQPAPQPIVVQQQTAPQVIYQKQAPQQVIYQQEQPQVINIPATAPAAQYIIQQAPVEQVVDGGYGRPQITYSTHRFLGPRITELDSDSDLDLDY
ncbi:hypothetical protein EJ02DRAFT_459069 [Clathrospora elynae]|uniref:Uncharacterized protein n=1 Tax=Clathrospora elynae TaxID=706981 RepID=A0A6A5SAF5_9PLEO|nr:hypothetical protein EJ02DRAFT_459069 [Clathrospora elynae]